MDGNAIPILCYGAGPVAWSDELTEVHEEVAGDDHYIDRASRHQRSAVAALAARVRRHHHGCRLLFFLPEVLRRRFPDCLIVGADCVPGPLERLSTNMPDIPLLQFDLTTCPLPDQRFDALVLLNV